MALAAALDKVASDPKFREQLDLRPVETLKELGIRVSPKERAVLAGKRLSEMIPKDIGGGRGQVAERRLMLESQKSFGL
jgi:hypothetical protein